jgi:serine/threonine protein kinase
MAIGLPWCVGLRYNDFAHRAAQILDAARGLEYMHSLKVAHADLKGVRPFIRSRILWIIDELFRQISWLRPRSGHVSPILACRDQDTTPCSRLSRPKPATAQEARFISKLRSFWPEIQARRYQRQSLLSQATFIHLAVFVMR